MNGLVLSLVPMAYAAVRDLNDWMQQHVAGFRPLGRDEVRSYANEMAVLIATDGCPCGLERCATNHRWSNRPGHVPPPLFVWRAVAGGNLANAIAGGMLYRLVLNPELGMLIAPVELRVCQECGRRFEGGRCPDGNCGGVFSPEDTMAVAEERLFVREVYRPEPRWGCGPVVGTPDGGQRRAVDHYYARPARRGDEEVCPLTRCPHGNPRRSQRPTTLWTFHGFGRGLPPDAPAPPDRSWRTARAGACGEWFGQLPEALRGQLRRAARAAGATDDPERFIDWLLAAYAGLAFLPAASVSALDGSLQQVNQAFGLEGGEDES